MKKNTFFSFITLLVLLFFTTMSYGQFLNNYLINSVDKTIKFDVGNNDNDVSCEFILKYEGTSLQNTVSTLICSSEFLIVSGISPSNCLFSSYLNIYAGKGHVIYTATTDVKSSTYLFAHINNTVEATSGSNNGSSVNVNPIITVNPVLILKPLNFLT